MAAAGRRVGRLIQYITLHLHYTTLQPAVEWVDSYITLHLHYMTLYYITLHYIALQPAVEWVGSYSGARQRFADLQWAASGYFGNEACQTTFYTRGGRTIVSHRIQLIATYLSQPDRPG